MIAKLGGLIATVVITILWLMGILSLYQIVDKSLVNQTLGDCWMQLTLPLGFTILGFWTTRSWHVFAGSVLVIAAISNHCNPKNGFLGSGGSWFWQVPIFATLGVILVYSGSTPKISFTKASETCGLCLLKLKNATQSPIVLRLFLLYGVASTIGFLIALAFGFMPPPLINRHLPLFVAVNVALGFAFASLSPRVQIRRTLLLSIAALLITACSALVFTFGTRLEISLRLQIASMLSFGCMLLSPSVLRWMEFLNSKNGPTQFTLADLLNCTFASAIGVVTFLMNR